MRQAVRHALWLAMLAVPLEFASAAPAARAGDEAAATGTLTDGELAKARALLLAGDAAGVVAMLESHPAVKVRDRQAEATYALALLRVGRLREAETIARVHALRAGKVVELYKLLGYIQLGNGDVERARTHFKLAALYSGDDAESRFQLAICDALERLDEKSIAAVKAFAAAQGELPAGTYQPALGNTLFAAGKARFARDPKDPLAAEWLSQAAEALPDRVEVLEALADVHLARAEHDAAREIAARMERDFDQFIERALLLRARIAEASGDLTKAYEHADAAIVLSNRKLFPALVLAGRVALAMDRIDDARRPLDDALNVNPSDYEANVLMARYLRLRLDGATDPGDREGFMKQIENRCQRAIGADGNAEEPFRILEQLYEMWGEPRAAQLMAVRTDLGRIARRAGN
jgi:tetratricopeptide (TPR) repeat protein